MSKLYAERDAEKQGATYLLHLEHMTSEDLYSKAAIAAELAHRDLIIKDLYESLEYLLENCEGRPKALDKAMEALAKANGDVS